MRKIVFILFLIAVFALPFAATAQDSIVVDTECIGVIQQSTQAFTQPYFLFQENAEIVPENTVVYLDGAVAVGDYVYVRADYFNEDPASEHWIIAAHIKFNSRCSLVLNARNQSEIDRPEPNDFPCSVNVFHAFSEIPTYSEPNSAEKPGIYTVTEEAGLYLLGLSEEQDFSQYGLVSELNNLPFWVNTDLLDFDEDCWIEEVAS